MANEKSVMAVIRASRPTFRNKFDKITFAIHATFLASGYILTATGPLAFSDDALSSSSTEEVGIEHWNEHDDEYAFVYTNPEKGNEKVLVKCLVINDTLMVDALAQGGSKPVHIELNAGEFSVENGGPSYSNQYKSLEKLVKRLDSEVLSKLDESSGPALLNAASSSEGSSRNVDEPGLTVSEPAGPYIHPSGVIVPPVVPVGGGDLLPGPGAGMYPRRGNFGDGSSLLGPNDPRWFGGVDREPGFLSGQPGVPPGARFDPYGPPNVPGFEPSRFTRNRPRPEFGTHPDLEQYRSSAHPDLQPFGGSFRPGNNPFGGGGSDFI